MSGLCVIKCSGAGALCGNKLINIHVQKKNCKQEQRRAGFLLDALSDRRRCGEAKCQVEQASRSEVITN
jgi:hypothetical protein